MITLRALVVWFALMSAEVLHGTARRLLLEPYVGEFRAHQVAVFTGSAIIFGITFALVRWLRANRASQLLAVGTLWLVLTVSFELILVRLVLNYPWERIAADYNLPHGGLMPVGLAVLAASPYMAGKLRKII